MNMFYGQNIIPNGSFESYSACPVSANTGSPDEVAKATGWYRIKQTPDYYNSCSTGTIVSTPLNFCGNQAPASGNAYMGLWVYDSGTSNFREAIAAKLTTTLNIGQKYFIKLTASNAEGYAFNCGIDKLGIRFSTVQHVVSAPPPINNFAHLYFTTVMADTLNWKYIFGSFVADSSYKYVEISNFYIDALTNVQVIKPYAANWAYYFVDDVALCTDSLEALNFNASSTNISESYEMGLNYHFFPIPSTGVVYNHINLFNVNVKIHDVFGTEINSFIINKNSIVFVNVPDGIYFITIQNQSEKIIEKILLKN